MFKKNASAKYLAILALFVAPLAIWGVISFGATSVTLSFSISNSGGTVVGSGVNCPGDCSQSFTLGSPTTEYTATPKSGFKFMGWDSNNDGVVNYTSNPLRVNHNQNWTFKAIFKRVSGFSTLPSDRSGGYVAGTQVNCPTDCYVYYDNSTSTYTYTAHPLNGYKFEGWDVGVNGTIDSRSLTYSLPLNQSLRVRAVFVKTPTCSLTVSPTTINRGASTRLSWSSTQVSSLKASWVSSVATSGSVSFAPASTKAYSVTAANVAGSKTCSATVTVIQPKTTTPTTPPKTTTPRTTTTVRRTVTARPPAASTVADSVAPSRPEALQASYEPSKGSTYLEWTPSTDNVAVAGYAIQRREKGQGAWVTITTSVYSANYLDLAVGTEKVYEYQVRAYDGKKNFSAWSETATVSTGPFQPNATPSEGGSIANDDQTVLVEVNAGDIEEDLFFSIEPVELIQIDYGKGYRSAGTIYEIRAKNSKGEEVTQFKSPITIKFGVDGDVVKQLNAKTIKLARSEDSLSVKIIEESNFDPKTNVVTAEVDHLTPYMVVAKNKSSVLTFFKNASIILFIIVILALPFAYWYYKKYKQKQGYTELQDELKY